MRHNGIFAAVLLLLSVPPLRCISQSSEAGRFPHSPQGFEAQYTDVFRAYKAGDAQRMKALLDGFAIPASWFTEVFGPEQGGELAKQYSAEFAYFEFSDKRRLVSIAGNADTTIELSPRPETAVLKPPPKPAPTSLKPVPASEKYEIHYYARTGSVTKGTKPSDLAWVHSFIYLDGAFRYFGTGAYPFWDPAKVRRADPCAPEGGQSGGQIVSKVEAEYPEEAKLKQVQGFVRMRVTVAKDGSVKDIEIIDGNPLLADAAKNAVVKWRYQPFMNCGEPVEMRSMEHVRFSLGQGSAVIAEPGTAAGEGSLPTRVRVSQGVSQGLILQKVVPVYPAQARQNHIQGAVVLRAVIGRDGVIHDLEVVSGAKELVPAATEAVRQWRYKPYMLLGRPVEVETQITVNFQLR